MLDHIVYANQPTGQRIKIAECDTRELAELVAKAINAYISAPVQEEANTNTMTETFRLTPDAIEVAWKAEATV